MAAEHWINDNNVARRTREIWVNDGGTARRIQEIWVNDNGVARKVYAGDVISIGLTFASALNTTPGSATAQFSLRNTGDIYRSTGTGGLVDSGFDWITPQTNMAGYECRATVTTGALTGGTTGAWQSLSTSRTWSRAQTSVGTSQCVFTLEIRRVADSTVVASASITLTSEVSN